MAEHDPAAPGAAPGPAEPAKLDWADLPTSPAAASSGAPRAPATAFTVGRFLGTIFSTWRRNALRFVGVAVAGAIPVAVVAYLAYRSSPPPSFDPTSPFAAAFQGWSRMLPTMGLGLLVYPVVMGAVMSGAVQALRRAPVTVGGMLSRALRRYFPVLGVYLLSTLAMAVTACTVVVPFLLAAGWCAAMGAAVMEGGGPVAAFRRSWALSRGLRWQAFAGFLVVLLAGAAVLLPVQLVMGAILGARGGLSFGERIAITQAAAQLAAAFSTSLHSVAFGVAYHQLREATEGTDASQLGRVFE